MFIIHLFFTCVAAILFMFQFWKKLKDDYTQNQIFTSGFYILLAIGAGNIISLNFLPAWWFWMSLLGGTFGLAAGVVRYKLKLFEAIDATVISSLFLFTAAFISDWYFSKSYFSLAGFVICLLLIIFYKFLDERYKRFVWYKSGRVGFSGLTVAGVFFIIRAVIAMINPNMVSFAGKSDIYISGVVAFLSFLSLFNLSREM